MPEGAVEPTGQELAPQPAAPEATPPTPEPTPPDAGAPSPADPPEAGDRDEPRFTQRQFDHLITQRLHEERQRVSRDFEAFRTEVAPQLAEAERLRQEREAAEAAQQTREQQLESELAALRGQITERDNQLATTQAAMREAARIQRLDQINRAIEQAQPNLPTEQRERIQRQFADAEQLDPAAISEAANTARAEVESMLRAWGFTPQGTQIGSAGSPPAEPQNTPYQQYEAQLVELMDRADAGDQQALVEYQALRANPPRP